MKYFSFFYFKKKVYKYRLSIIIILLLLIVYVFSLPRNLLVLPTCTVVRDKDHNLLGAKIADDGQWRFPHNKFMPDKFKKAIIEFEDRKFYSHPGFNPYSLGRALIQNIKAKKIIREVVLFRCR